MFHPVQLIGSIVDSELVIRETGAANSNCNRLLRLLTQHLRKSLAPVLLLFSTWVAPLGLGQNLEPRAYSVSPVGTNALVSSYLRSSGDLAFDPTLPVENATASLNSASLGYFRSIDFLGRSANVTVHDEVNRAVAQAVEAIVGH